MRVLGPFRDKIDAIDDQLVELLARRYEVVHRVAEVKREHGIDPILPDRVQAVKDRVAARSRSVGLDPDLAVRLWTIIIDEACALESRLIAARSAEGDTGNAVR